MPGHAGLMRAVKSNLEALARLDVTELPDLDDLHMPQGIIAEAQKLMAQACGAQESYFLLNGATSGIHALLMCGTTSAKVIIPRHSHRSFWGGLVLSGSSPVWIPGEIQPDLGIALSVKPQAIAQAAAMHQGVEVAWLTSPTYYGTCCDVATVRQLLPPDIALMVDEAHGAHFPFHPLYPHPALSDGAAAVVNGLHKTWPVLTSGACLHLGQSFFGTPRRSNWNRSKPPSTRWDLRLKAAYHLLTTTSPSYPLLASIDLARAFMQQEGMRYLERAQSLAAKYKSRLNQIKGIRCYGAELATFPGVKAVDPLKVVIGLEGLALSGIQMARILRDEYRIEVEVAQPRLIVAMFSLLHDILDWEYFFKSIDHIAASYPANGKAEGIIYSPPRWHMELTPRQAFWAPKRRVKMEKSLGRVAGEMVSPYPPGIPCLLPGELITADIIEYIGYLKSTQVNIQGPDDPNLEYILIID